MAKYKRQSSERHDQDLGKEPNIKLTQPISNLIVPDNTTLSWKAGLESPTKLRTTKFGRPDKEHSVTQEACAKTILFFIIKSDYLDDQSIHALYATNPLIPYMARMTDTLSRYNFR